MIEKKTSRKSSKKGIRVSSGQFKGRSISCPPGEIRPLTAKVKEALFSIIYDKRDLKMLDMFSGSASISIEAFSRGQLASCDIVEGDRGKKEVLINNIKTFGMDDLSSVIIRDAFSFLKSTSSKYDFIMLDPPFAMNNKKDLLKIINDRELLEDKGIIVIHLPKKEELPLEFSDIYQYDIRTYGLNCILFYKRKNEQ